MYSSGIPALLGGDFGQPAPVIQERPAHEIKAHMDSAAKAPHNKADTHPEEPRRPMLAQTLASYA